MSFATSGRQRSRRTCGGKNTLTIVGHETGRQVQGYFVDDSKTSSTVTVSPLRFADHALDAPYLVEQADFVGCHPWEFVDQLDPLARIRPGGTLLLNSPYRAGQTWQHLPVEMGRTLREKAVRVYGSVPSVAACTR